MAATDPPGFDFFFYGTLRDAALRTILLGREVAGVAAELPGHEAVPVARGRYPMLQARRDRRAAGVFCSGVTLDEAARLSLYEEEGRDYTAARHAVVLQGGAAVRAWMFVPLPRLRRGPGRWNLEEWSRYARPAALEGARRFMRALAPDRLDGARAIWRGRARLA